MERMAREGWLPDLSLWDQPDTLLSGLAPVKLAGSDMIMYSCNGRGIARIVEDFESAGFEVTQVRG